MAKTSRVSIPTKRYEELLNALLWKEVYVENGVDKWENYAKAEEDYVNAIKWRDFDEGEALGCMNWPNCDMVGCH